MSLGKEKGGKLLGLAMEYFSVSSWFAFPHDNFPFTAENFVGCIIRAEIFGEKVIFFEFAIANEKWFLFVQGKKSVFSPENLQAFCIVLQALLFGWTKRIILEMSRRGYQQNAMGGCEERRIEAVVCPKPRRFDLLSPSMAEPIRPLRYPVR